MRGPVPSLGSLSQKFTSVHVLTLFCEHWRGRHEWGSFQFTGPDLDRCISLAEANGWTVSRERRMATCPACTKRFAEVEGRNAATDPVAAVQGDLHRFRDYLIASELYRATIEHLSLLEHPRPDALAHQLAEHGLIIVDADKYSAALRAALA